MKLEVTIIPAARGENKTKEFTFQDDLKTNGFIPIAVELEIDRQIALGDVMNAFMFQGEFYAWRKM